MNQSGLSVQINGSTGASSTNTLEITSDGGVTRQWTISGTNAGTVGNVSFSSMNSLEGAANDTNIFTLQAGAVFNGGIAGGTGGTNTLVLQGVTGSGNTISSSTVTVTTTGGQSQIQFTDLQGVVVDGTGAGSGFTFETPSSGNVISISSPGSGENMISGTSDGTPFESVTFQNLATVTINTATNDGATPSQGDTVTILGGLGATGLTNFNIVTGNGNNLVDLSQLGTFGSVTLSINAGTGSDNTLVAPAGATALSNTILSIGSQHISLTNPSNAGTIQNVELAGTLATNTFTGVVISAASAASLPDLPVIGQFLSLALASGSLWNQILQYYNVTNSTLASVTSSSLANFATTTFGAGNVTANGSTYTINVSPTLSFSSEVNFSALGGSVTLNGGVMFSATVNLKMVIGVGANGFYIQQTSSSAPLFSLSSFSMSGNSLAAVGNFGLANVTISSPSLIFTGVGLSLNLGSTTQYTPSNLPAALAASTVTLQTGTVTLSLDVDLSSVLAPLVRKLSLSPGPDHRMCHLSAVRE